MTAAFVCISIVPPFILGFLLVDLLWAQDRRLLDDFALKCCFSVGLGVGVSSCLTFVWMAFAGRLNRGLFIVELALIVTLGARLLFRRRNFLPRLRGDRPHAYDSRKPYWLRAAVAVGCVTAVIRFVCFSLADPNGEWDAFAIWNMHARFLYRGGDSWTHFRFMTWSHPDYPLLIPASVARSWEFVGRESKCAPAVIAFLFTFALIGVVSISIARLRGERQGLLAALVLLGTPFLITHGASQYADVPLSFFFAASLSLLLLYLEGNTSQGLLVLAGLTSGLAAWTKNEGILFVTAFFIALCLAALLFKDKTSSRVILKAWPLGCVPLIIVIALYKALVRASNDLISVNNASNIHHFLQIWRFQMIVGAFAKEALTFGGWRLIFPIPAILAFYFLLMGATVDRRKLPATLVSVALPILMCCGYFAIYVVSPHDLKWHLDSSLNRLLLQVWPLCIIAFFTIVRSPEQALLSEYTLHRERYSDAPQIINDNSAPERFSNLQEDSRVSRD